MEQMAILYLVCPVNEMCEFDYYVDLQRKNNLLKLAKTTIFDLIDCYRTQFMRLCFSIR